MKRAKANWKVQLTCTVKCPECGEENDVIEATTKYYEPTKKSIQIENSSRYISIVANWTFTTEPRCKKCAKVFLVEMDKW